MKDLNSTDVVLATYTTVIPFTPELYALVDRSSSPPSAPIAPLAKTGGYSFPMCVYCPAAQYSDAAVKAKLQTTIYLLATIGVNGRASNIVVVNRKQLGLEEKAVDAVRKWRFTPAKGPDGKSAAVRQTIEVQFHLYSRT
ncbi:MAG: energy transducer TonB [Candidatus Acidiferrales bacterium]